jgi:hypothetical protein
MNRRAFLAAMGAAGASLAVGAAAARPMKVLLWCWDARMTWDDEPDAISTKMAAAEQRFPYPKRAESFGIGFRRLVDYCAKEGIWGVIVWGFLRDCHGGVRAARDLCKYASDKGVKILPGVGLCSYGGYYFDGDHPYNLDTYLREHPERASRAVEEGGKREVGPVLDPSVEANQRWWRDGLEWMLDTFEIGGIDYEMGDFIVNPSPGAQAARNALGFDADGNVMDVVVATRGLMERALELRPDGVFINCTYRGFHQIENFPSVPYAQALPNAAVWEYTLTGMVRQPEFPDGYGPIPPHRMYGYLHWFNASTGTAAKDYSDDIARVYRGLGRLGFEFAGTYGEISPQSSPVADRNYRAQAEWARKPGQA